MEGVFNVKILVVEDEKNIANYLKKGLEETGYTVDIANDGIEAEYLASKGNYKIILLDIMIPKLDGVEVCKILRKKKIGSYIIMVTAKDKISDKVTGLDAGADDYITKPYEFAELLARIRAIFRRKVDKKETMLKYKDLKVDLLTRTVTRQEIPIDLTAKEFLLIEYFLKNTNQILTRTMIADRVWENNFFSDNNVIDVYINHLRNKIDKGFDEKIIHTSRGIGYVMK